MISYKKHKFDKVPTDQIVRVNEDGSQSYIPNNPDNADRIEYDKWVAEGNTPEEADQWH